MKTFLNALRTIVILSLCMNFCSVGNAQVTSNSTSSDTASYPYWIGMMQDPGANYYTTVSAFNKYWKNRTIKRGCGWKVFKRWEYIMRGRVANDGAKPAPDDVYKKWRKFSQGSQNDRSPYGSWVSMGPSAIPAPGPAGYEGLGRINVIAFHPTNQNKVFVGSPSGGFWMTNDNGVSWMTTTDNLPTIGVSAIAVDMANPDNILIGTGDRDHGDAPGMGVFKSTDGGQNWIISNAGMGYVTVCQIIQQAGNSQVCFAATSGGIFRTGDGGENWTLTQPGNFNDICFKPNDPAIIYAVSNANFYRSSDNGLSFVHITSGLIAGQRGAIAVSPAAPGYVYFLQSDNNSGFQGLFRSVDAGLTFSARSTSPNILDWSCDGSDTGGQGWYDLAVTADPLNAEIVYVGGVDVWKSTNGGTTWDINSHWYGGCDVPAVHADCHFLGYSPANGRLYAGNDGGIYYTANGGVAWTDCTVGMTIGQIYKIGQSQTDPGKTISGFQDNGTYTSLASGWVATGGGDGMECAVDFQDAAYSYHTIYFGDIFRNFNNGSTYQVAGKNVNGIDESGAWVTPFILGETDPKVMFAGYKNVWKCANVRLSPPVWTKISSGETEDCSVLEQSPANTGIVYVVRSGSMQRTDNANDASPTWVPCPLPGGNTPSDLEAHPSNPDIVYATAYNKVYKSVDRGASWNLVPGALPDIPVNAIVYDKTSSEGLYIGTQAGVLYKNPDLPDWVVFSTGLPVVDVRELEIYYNADPANNRIMAATYGRGLWRSDLFSITMAPQANFSVSPPSPCLNDTAQLTDLSLNFPNTWSWSFSPATVTFVNSTSSTSQNPQVQFNQNTNYTATLVAYNAIGSSGKSLPVTIGGIQPPYAEYFESGSFPGGWKIVNPDNSITWTVATAGGNGISSKSAYIDFYSYTNSGTLDDMITVPVKLAGTLHPWLKFNVAYRRYNSSFFDGLKIFISEDCGTTWNSTPVYDKSGSILATGPDQEGGFVPAASSDWRLDSVDLTPFRLSSLKIKFQAVNGYGNNLFIDNISVTEAPVLAIPTTTIAADQATCFNASQVILVAGGGTGFIVQPGGSATLIAGLKIVFQPGTEVSSGGYLDGYISPSGPYCTAPALPGAYAGETSLPGNPGQPFFRVYPNPTTGSFTIRYAGSEPSALLHVEIYSSRGEKLISRDMSGGLKYDIPFAEKPAGLYFVRLFTVQKSGTVKLVKL